MPHPLLAAYPVTITLPVQWAEMDAYGHVNNTVLFKYFESARIVYLERCGLAESYEKQRVGAILHSTFCRFRQPLVYPSQVEIGARCSKLEEDRFTTEYAVVTVGGDAVVAEGWGVVVCFDYTAGRKVPIPAEIRRAIGIIEGKP